LRFDFCSATGWFRLSVGPPESGDGGGEDQADGEVDPEDVAPGAEGEHHGAVQRAEDAAELLHRPDHAEGHAASFGGVEVGDERERHRHQATATHALQETTGDQAAEVVRRCGDQRAEREDHECCDKYGSATAEIGDPADQREHRDVTEEEAAHDRGGTLQLVDVEPDRAHHVGEGEHDDVGVGGRECHGDGCQAEQELRRPTRTGDGSRSGTRRWAVRHGAQPITRTEQ
jgi:hypothetical protein